MREYFNVNYIEFDIKGSGTIRIQAVFCMCVCAGVVCVCVSTQREKNVNWHQSFRYNPHPSCVLHVYVRVYVCVCVHAKCKKGNSLPIHAIKIFRGKSGIASVILNLGTRCRHAINFTPRPLYPLERTPVPT